MSSMAWLHVPSLSSLHCSSRSWSIDKGMGNPDYGPDPDPAADVLATLLVADGPAMDGW